MTTGWDGYGISRYSISLLPLHLLTLRVARSRIGVSEQGENWGPEVERYLHAAGIHQPAPWCAAFVNYCAEVASDWKGVTSPLESVTLQAYVQSYYDWAEQDNLFVEPADAGPGDLFLLWYGWLNRWGHIGFVQEVRDRTYDTIEGNAAKPGTRDARHVLTRTRKLTNAVAFVRWS